MLIHTRDNNILLDQGAILHLGVDQDNLALAPFANLLINQDLCLNLLTDLEKTHLDLIQNRSLLDQNPRV